MYIKKKYSIYVVYVVIFAYVKIILNVINMKDHTMLLSNM